MECDAAPNSPACWLPGLAARILFAANDGMLYRFDFEKENGGRTAASERDARPHVVEWKCDPPGSGRVAIHEPYWPRDSAFAGRIVVSLSYDRRRDNKLEISSPEVWWLRLNHDATEIEEAGALDRTKLGRERRAIPGDRPRREWSPCARGGLIQRGTSDGWELSVAGLDLSGADAWAHSSVDSCAGSRLHPFPADALTRWPLGHLHQRLRGHPAH